MAGDLMETFAHYAAKPLPCSVPLAVVLYGAGNHQPVVSRKVTFALVATCALMVGVKVAEAVRMIAGWL